MEGETLREEEDGDEDDIADVRRTRCSDDR